MASSVTTFTTTPADIDSATAYLGTKPARPIANQTELVRYTDHGPAHITHHGYIIATFEPAPHTHSQARNRRPIARLRTAGYNSASTARRLDTLLQAALADLPDHGTHHKIRIKHGHIVLHTTPAPDSPLKGRTETVIGTRSLAVYTDGHIRTEVDPIPDRYGQTQLHPDHRTQ